jgi:hypothetical protein
LTPGPEPQPDRDKQQTNEIEGKSSTQADQQYDPEGIVFSV